MSGAREAWLERMFHRAAALPTAEREALLLAATAPDGAALAELRALLAQLERPTPDGLEPRFARPAAAADPRRRRGLAAGAVVEAVAQVDAEGSRRR
jgi:hypothetical protein